MEVTIKSKFEIGQCILISCYKYNFIGVIYNIIPSTNGEGTFKYDIIIPKYTADTNYYIKEEYNVSNYNEDFIILKNCDDYDIYIIDENLIKKACEFNRELGRPFAW